MAEKLGGEGKVVVLRGIPTVIDDERIQGFTDGMKDTNIEILDIQYANWNQEEAFSLMQHYLAKYSHIDAVWANNNDMLLGVLETVKQSGRTEIKYALGSNGMKDVIEMVKANDPVTPISTHYPPSMIKSAIYMTAAQFAGQAPMRQLQAGCTADHAGKRRPVLFPRQLALTTVPKVLRPSVPK